MIYTYTYIIIVKYIDVSIKFKNQEYSMIKKKKKKMTRNDSSHLFKRLYLTIIFNDYTFYYSEYRLYSLQIFQ